VCRRIDDVQRLVAAAADQNAARSMRHTTEINNHEEMRRSEQDGDRIFDNSQS